MVVTEQRGSDVAFEAHENIGTLWSKPGAPRAVWTLPVTTRRDQTSETALWQIETAPPALQPNEHYIVSVRGPAGGGRTGFTFEPRRTSLYVPPHRWRDATSDLLARPVRLTVTEETCRPRYFHHLVGHPNLTPL